MSDTMKYTETERQDAIKVDEAIAAMNAGEFEAAAALIDDVISRGPRPDNYEPWYEEDGVRYQRYWNEDDREFLVEALKSHPEAPEIVWLPSAYPRAYFARGFLKIQEGDAEGAIGWLMAADACDPTAPEPKIELATAATLLGEFETAMRLYDMALNCRPIQPPWIVARCLRGRGYCLVEFGRLGEALELFQQSLEHDPSSEVARSEIDYIRGLQAGTHETVSGSLSVTGPGGDLTLPGQPSMGVLSLVGELMALRNEGVISADDFERAQARLMDETRIIRPTDMARFRSQLDSLRSLLLAGTELNCPTPEHFEAEKLACLEALFEEPQPAPQGAS